MDNQPIKIDQSFIDLYQQTLDNKTKAEESMKQHIINKFKYCIDYAKDVKELRAIKDVLKQYPYHYYRDVLVDDIYERIEICESFENLSNINVTKVDDLELDKLISKD